MSYADIWHFVLESGKNWIIEANLQLNVKKWICSCIVNVPFNWDGGENMQLSVIYINMNAIRCTFRCVGEIVCFWAWYQQFKPLQRQCNSWKSINSKTIFMLVVTSRQIFDNIQLINPNIVSTSPSRFFSLTLSLSPQFLSHKIQPTSKRPYIVLTVLKIPKCMNICWTIQRNCLNSGNIKWNNFEIQMFKHLILIRIQFYYQT